MDFSLISIIVPIYKVEKYLCKCVDSILAQTYKNIKVIFVDDGSPDGCPAICDEYSENDKKHKKVDLDKYISFSSDEAVTGILHGQWEMLYIWEKLFSRNVINL